MGLVNYNDAAKGTKECSVVSVGEFLEEWSDNEGDRDDLVMLDDADLNSSDTTTDATELLSQTPNDHVICWENKSTALKTACDKRLIDAVLRRKTKHVAPKWKSTYAGRKHKVAELQDELQKLQDKLSRLQAGQTRTTASSTALTARQFSSTSIVVDNVAFEKRLAGRERELLLYLHCILMGRVEKAALLENRLRSASPQWSQRWSQRGIASGDELVFSSLLEETAFMEVEANRIAHTLQSRLPWPQPDSSFRQRNVTRSGLESQLCLEIVNSKEVPFSRVNVNRAMRLECGESNRKMREYAATVRDSLLRDTSSKKWMDSLMTMSLLQHFGVQNEAILGKFHLRYASDYDAGPSRCRGVVKATRSNFLTVLRIDSVNDNGEPANGYMIKDRIWTVLHHVNQDEEDDDRNPELNTP